MASEIAGTYGVVLIGCIFAAFLYGIVCVQTCRYNIIFSEGSGGIRRIVNTLWFIDTLHVAVMATSLYYFLIVKRMDLKIGGSPFWMDGLVLIVANVSDSIVRGVFIYKICHLTRYNLVLVVFLGLMAATALGFGTTCGIMLIHIAPAVVGRTLTWPVYTALASSAAADIAISLTMIYLFVRFGQRVETAQPLLHRLMIYSMNAGILPSVIALTSLITYIICADTYIAMAIFFVLPQATLNTMLAMLNARTHLRRVLPAWSKHLGKMRVSVGSVAPGALSPLNFAHSPRGQTEFD